MKQYGLKDWSDSPDKFFKALPGDWADELRTAWPSVAMVSKIFVFADKTGFRCGGVVSQGKFPDMGPYLDRAQELYGQRYWYIGYLYVNPDFRSEGLGSRWLEMVRTAVPARGFWLVIEKIGLLKFYTRSNFHVERILTFDDHKEWLLVSPREDW